MKKKEYLHRISRRVVAMALAMLMSLSIFAQTLPKVNAAEDVSSSDVAAAAEDAEIVTGEIPAEKDETQTQIDETIDLEKAVSPSDTTLPDTDVPAPAAAVSTADASVNDVPAIDVSASDIAASDVSTSDVSASDVLSPEFHAEKKMNGWTISVYAPEGVIPENAELRITDVNGALRDKAEEVADVEFDILVDVTIFADGEEIQPDTRNGLVQISLTKDGAVSGAFEIYHFNEAVSDVEILDTEICGDTATAEVEHFSLIGGDDSIKTWSAFAAAVSSAASGDTIKLDGDIVRDGDATAITLTKNLTIDLNGHKLSSTSDYKNNGNLFSMSGSGELRVTVKNGTIDGFKNDGDGGAFYLSGSSLYLTLNDVTIKNCASAKSGGAVYASGGNPRVFVYVSGSVFKNCMATGTGVAYYPTGGGAILLNCATLEISNTTITGCSATNCAGGIGVNNSSTVLSYEGVDIYGNSADWVGGMSLVDSQWVLSNGNCKIHGNSSSDYTTDVYVLMPPNDGAIYFSNNANQVSPIYISLDDSTVFCKQSGYMDYQSLFVSTVPNKVVRKPNAKNGLGLVKGRRVFVDSAIKNGTVAVQPWYDYDHDINVRDFTSTTGGTVSFSVTPATGYELDKLYYVKYDTTDKIDITTYDETKKLYSFNMPDNDVTIYSTFKGLEYTLTVDSSISNGTVTAANAKYKTGDTVSLTVTPATNYALDTLYYKVEGDTAEHPIDGTSFTMPAGNVTVYATFKQDHIHTWKYNVMGVVTIKAFCTDADCPDEYTQNKNPLYVSMSAPSADYTGEPYAALSINNTITPVIGETLTITYRGDSDTTYAESETPPTDLGTYIVKASIAGKSIEQRFWIMKPDQELSCEKVTMEIGETGKKLEPKHTVGDGAISYKVNKAGLSVDKDGNLTATAAGTYKVTVTAAETEKYAAANVIVTVTVTKKTQTISGDTEIKDFAIGSDPIALSSKNVKTNANGNTLTYTVTEGSDYITVDDSGNVTAVKPGTAKIKVSAAAYGDYDAAEDLIITVTVIKGTQTISGSETMTVYYGGDLTDPTKPIKLDAALDKTDAEGKLSYTSSSLVVCEVADDGTLTIKKPGTVKITVSAPATTLYNAPADKEINITVNPRPLTITLNNKSAKVGEAMPTFDYVAPTLVGSDTLPATFVKFTCTAPVTDDKLTTAGSYDITAVINNAKFLALYNVTFTEAKLTVTQHEHVWTYELNDACDTALAYCTNDDDKCEYYGKDKALKFTLKVPAVHTGASSLVYDGEAFPVIYDGEENAKFITECGLDPIDPASDITYLCGGEISHTAPVNAGTYSATVNIAKKDHDGYLNIGASEGKSQHVTFTIAKAEQTITTGDDVTMTIGETGKSVTASVAETNHGTLSYVISPTTGLTVAADGTLTATAAGTYTVTAKAAETDNYNAATCTDTITVTVNKKTQTITVPNETITVTYGTPVSIGASADDSAKLTYVSNATDYFSVDSTGKVTFVKADASGTKTVTVKAAATDTYAAAEKTVYVKTEKAVLTLLFDDSDPNNAYAGETAADALARISGKVTGFVNNDTQDTVGTMETNIRNSSGSLLVPTDELLTDSTYKYVLQFTLNSTKAECYTVNPSVLVRDTAITVSKRDQTVTPAQETVYVKVGDSGSVSATTSETPITSVPVLSADKLGPVTYTIKGTSSIVTAVDKATGALTLSGDEGSVTIIATAAGNDYYNAATAEITVVVTKKLDPEPEVSYLETIYMGETDRTVSVKTESNGTVTISIGDGKSISLTPASDGKTADVTTLEPGTTKVHIKIAETDDYASFDGDYDIEVKKRDQTVTADNITLYTGEKKTVSATVAEAPISGVNALTGQTGALSYDVKSGTGDAVTVDKTTGELTFVKAGTATVTITADSNDIYNKQTKDITITVKKRTQEVKANDMTIADTDSGIKLEPTVSEVAVSGVSSLSGKTAKPVFKSSDESIATVDENGVVTVKKPGKITISMTLPENDYYNEVPVPTDITLTIDPLAVIEGAGGKYKVGSKEGLTFRSNGVFANFVGIQVDDKDVDASNYTAWSGSTYVKFKTKYLNSLTTGKHKLTYLFKNGKCSTYFYVVRPSRGGGSGYSPETGDEANIILWMNLNVLSMIVIAAVVIDRRRRRKSITK